jgi:N-acyl-D-aspartate/D-glutamate deacylase
VHDLVIRNGPVRNGPVVDGTGAPPSHGDVAVDGGRIVEHTGALPGRLVRGPKGGPA